jgi:hypothetical protein
MSKEEAADRQQSSESVTTDPAARPASSDVDELATMLENPKTVEAVQGLQQKLLMMDKSDIVQSNSNVSAAAETSAAGQSEENADNTARIAELEAIIADDSKSPDDKVTAQAELNKLKPPAPPAVNADTGGRRRTKRKHHKKGKSAKKGGKKHRKSSGKKSRRSSSKKSRRQGRK